jgi:hypothetical protein
MSKLGQLSTRKSPTETRQDIEEVFRKWGIYEYRIPRDSKARDGPARVIFYVNDAPHELNCMRFHEYAENLRAIYLILDSLRKAHDRGILSELARAAIAFLPPGSATVKRAWYEVLGVTPTTPMTVVKAAYKALASERHPDAGGSDEAMSELNAAYEEYRRERSVSG